MSAAWRVVQGLEVQGDGCFHKRIQRMAHGQGCAVFLRSGIHQGTGGTAETLEAVAAATSFVTMLITLFAIRVLCGTCPRFHGARPTVGASDIGSRGMRCLDLVPAVFAGRESTTQGRRSGDGGESEGCMREKYPPDKGEAQGGPQYTGGMEAMHHRPNIPVSVRERKPGCGDPTRLEPGETHVRSEGKSGWRVLFTLILSTLLK